LGPKERQDTRAELIPTLCSPGTHLGVPAAHSGHGPIYPVYPIQIVPSVSPLPWQSCFLPASGFCLCKIQCGSQLFSAQKKAETASSSSMMLLAGDTVCNTSAGATDQMNAAVSL